MKFTRFVSALSLALIFTLVASTAFASSPQAESPSLSPTSLDFGDQLTGSTSTAQTVTLTNNDPADLTIGTLSVSGEFALSNDLCSGQVIASAASCTFDVTFSPLTDGAKTGSVSISSDSITSPDTLALDGNGVSPILGMNPSSLDFGNQAVNTSSSPQTVTLSNDGTADLALGTLSVSGEFALNNDLCSNQNILPTATCTFEVTFSPLSLGAKNGSVSVPSNAASSPDSLALSGIGVENTWYIATTGDDNNDCLSPSTPCATINAALVQATAGDTLLVAEGTYGETVIVNKNLIMSGGWDAAFITKNGHSIIDRGGGENVHGIVQSANLTISNFIIQNSHYGINKLSGTLTFSNGALNNNKNGLRNIGGGATFTNTTFSGNNSAGTAGSAISNVSGTITIYYSTITNNQGYSIWSPNGSALINIGSSILAQNGVSCTFGSNITSKGYNLFSSTESCVTLKSTDISVTSPLITPLSTEGYHALVAGSPAIDHGNPANCPATDQRGVSRPIGSGCDSGAYEGFVTTVSSITLPDANPAIAPIVNFTVTFNDSVTGVDLTDFKPTVSGVTGAKVISVTGSGRNYTVAVKTGVGDGAIGLLLRDNDSIVDSKGNPLGGAGSNNGNFTSSKKYIIWSNPRVRSISLANPNPTSLSVVSFTVIFSEKVTDVSSSDFIIATTGGIKNASINNVTHNGATTIVSVNTGIGEGTIGLNLVDDDSIKDSKNNSLGGAGVGNGNFTGSAYTKVYIPTPIAPKGTITDPTPKYEWKPVPGASNYEIQVYEGYQHLHTITLAAAGLCSTTCSYTHGLHLNNAPHKWRVQAKKNGQWKGYTDYVLFTVNAPILTPPSAGFWQSSGEHYTDFYVTTNRSVDNFSILVTVYACNLYNQKLTYTPLVPINPTSNRFSKDGFFWFTGNFSNRTTAYGQIGMNGYYWPGCGYLYGGPFNWNGSWINGSQPDAATSEVFEFSVSPMPKDLKIPPTVFDLFNP